MKRFFTLILSISSLQSVAQIPAGDMENWHTYTVDGTQLEAPDGWFGSDSAIFAFHEAFPLLLLTPEKQIFQSGTSHGGNSAARIETKDIGSIFGLAGGSLSNARIAFNQSGLTFVGGTPVSEHISYVNAWVRYTSGNGNDSGSMTITAIAQGSNGDSVIGGGTVMIGETNSNYIHISSIVSYDMNIVPSKIQITFNSSATTPEDGSKLWVDDIGLSTLNVNTFTLNSDLVKIYPNPSSGVVSVYNSLNEPLKIEAFTTTGQKIVSKEFIGNDILDLTSMSSGMYFYSISNQSGEQVQHGKLSILK